MKIEGFADFAVENGDAEIKNSPHIEVSGK